MSRVIKIGGQFSGVGAFDQALMRLGIEFENIYQAEWDKYARQTYLHNYEEPKYYVEDVYDTPMDEITEKYGSLDIAMFSPPCQAFSLAGKRLGKDDQRGILFFNSHEFIKVNKPRFFIFENVKGLLSDDSGNTFSEWINMLGGKSVNGLPVLFPYEDSVPYHIYWKVLNARDFNIPQNRERVFIIGIRDDQDNVFQFPKEQPLQKRLKDVLEENVTEKYFLSDKAINGFVEHTKRQQDKGNGFKFDPNYGDNIASSVLTRAGSRPDDNFIKVKSATKSGYEIATENDSINFSVPNSETRRGRVGKGVCQTLDTACNQGVMVVAFGRSEEEKKRRREHFKATGKDSGSFKDKQLILKDQEHYDTLLANPNPIKEGLISENYRIRRLTPRECFRLMDFPDSFTWTVSDSQAYKQAGNSICVGVLAAIINQLKKL
jgi:DNA (cytosine-5)-methyltransferase 1